MNEILFVFFLLIIIGVSFWLVVIKDNESTKNHLYKFVNYKQNYIYLKIIERPILFIFFSFISIYLLFQTFMAISNLFYPYEYFDEILNIDHVFASKRWHNEIFGCTYAVIKFKKGATPTLIPRNDKQEPAIILGKNPWLANWETTPVPENKTFVVEAILTNCLSELPSNVSVEIQKLLHQNGSWYFQHGGTLGAISPISRLAFQIRCGD